MIHAWHGDRRKYRRVLVFRGVLYGSIAWPLFAAGVFLAAELWTSRRNWTPPHMKGY